MKRRYGAWISMIFAIFSGSLWGQTTTNIDELHRLSREFTARYEQRRGAEFERLYSMTTGPQGRLNANPDFALIGIDERGRPIIYRVHNIDAAATISTDEVWPGGASGYNLTGVNTEVGELGIWDGGAVRGTHQEFGIRVLQMDNAGDFSSHATHTSGTLIASGVQGNARGMSYQAPWLSAYDWNNDTGEMAQAATEGLKVSSHSYGVAAGWDTDGQDWYWFGDMNISESEDYTFGYYDSGARSWDQVAYNAPYYTICTSAGNDRGDGPMQQPIEHYVYTGGGWVLSHVVHERDGGADGFDCIISWGNAKNIITVGAVEDVPGGYNGPGSVRMTSFSCWGPSDDGRIKPDICANGVQLYSSIATGDAAYARYSGTSMSSPNLAGSINLLAQFYKETHGEEAPRASTIKALLAHTADECGAHAGPDYSYGWGLANIWHAADVIHDDEEDAFRIIEAELHNHEQHNYFYLSDGEEPITVTISWTDPPSSVSPAALNERTSKLVNDLDVRLVHLNPEITFFPYVLDPDNPGEAATMDDNVVDNVEKIYLAAAPEGMYRIDISHKNELYLTQSQVYSIIVSGVEWTPDPRIPPENLVATLDEATGAVNLNWGFPIELDEFIEFKIYRDGELIGTSGQPEAEDTLEEFGSYSYTVTALWTEGESLPTGPAQVVWLSPVSPRFLQLADYNPNTGEVALHWRHYRDSERAYDDGVNETSRRFNLQGGIFAQRFTEEEPGMVLQIGAYLIGTEIAPFGEMQWLLYAQGNNATAPGNLIYESEPLLPDTTGWTWIDLGLEGLELPEGGDFWIGLEWRVAGHTDLGWDTSGELFQRGFFSTNGIAWQPTIGPLAGNPMIRAIYGVAETIAPQELDALLGYTILRDGENIGAANDWEYHDLLPAPGRYGYVVRAEYDQGYADSDILYVQHGEAAPLVIPLQGRYFELISTNLVPPDLNAMNLFGGIPHLEIVYQNDGGIVLPPIINTIGDISVTQGYQIYCSAASEMTFTGTPVDPGIEFSLFTNTWNWLAYPLQAPVAVEAALSEITDEIVIVMTDDGGMWIPPVINTLGMMEPGEGYFVFVDNDVTFQYTAGNLFTSMTVDRPGGFDDVSAVSQGSTLQPGLVPSPIPTGQPYAVLVTLSEELRNRGVSIIELYDQDLLVGAAAVNNDGELIPVIAWHGSPEFNLPGFITGHPIQARLFTINRRELPCRIGGRTPEFGEGAYAEINLNSDSSELPDEFTVRPAYPNPFNLELKVEFSIPADGNVSFTVFNVIGQVVFSREESMTAGEHQILFNSLISPPFIPPLTGGKRGGVNAVSGLYFLKLEYQGQVNTQKVLLLK